MSEVKIEETESDHNPNEMDHLTIETSSVSPKQESLPTNCDRHSIEDSEEKTIADNIQNELDSGLRIISEIIKQNKTTCWPFMDAVDAEGLGLWDYHLKIKEPMWLNKIVENFEENKYSSFAEFARDFRLMVENCYRYNTTEHPISKKAKRLEMLFEGKLALLKKGIRESATIAKTSNGRFATLADEGNSTMRSGRISIPANGVCRDIDSETQGRFVYDFVRCEEATLAEDERLASYRERKQQQTLYQQVAAAFVSSLESREDAKEIRRCHYLPEIGLFLHLNESTLRLPPLVMYSLEMSLLIPADSLFLSKLMTSFLCTYYERSLIYQRAPMQFKTWENRLKQRVEKWFEMALKYDSYQYAADKLSIDVNLFLELKWKNPFYTDDGNGRSFLDLTYNEKAAIIKAVCDNMTTFQSVQNNIASLPCEQSRVMSLGYDVAGNEYIYFPQFCGDDLRIYRHRQHGELIAVDAPRASTVLVKFNKDKPMIQGESCTINQEEFSSPINKNDDNYEPCESEEEAKMIDEKPQIESDSMLGSHSETKMSASVSDFCSPAQENSQANDGNVLSQNSSALHVMQQNNDSQSSHSAADLPNSNSDLTDGITYPMNIDTESKSSEITSTVTNVDSSIDSKDETLCKQSDPVNSSELLNSSMSITPTSKSESITDSPVIKECKTQNAAIANVSSGNEAVTVPSQVNESYTASNSHKSVEVEPKTPKLTTRKRIKKGVNDVSTGSPLRRSSRKRAAVNYNSMLTHAESDSLATSEASSTECFTPKKRQKRVKKQKTSHKTAKIVKVEEPEEEYGSVEFEMVCDSIDSLVQLLSKIESEYEDALREKKSNVIINNVSSLMERLKWLLGELQPFESHLEKARFDAKIRLKREHDEIFRAATTGKAIQTASADVDPWEDEIISKNNMLQGENSSTHTPPASIYLEESDEESDQELRRSKRKPKRYESDEDFTLDSSDESPSHQITSFLYDEFDEGRLRLVPAALIELENRLQKQAASLQKMVNGGRVTRQNEFKDAGQLVINERRTRQKSKQENKVFRKILILAYKVNDEFGPSLLPLLRTDQSEIGEVVERVLAQEAVARQQRKLAREEEQRQKRALRLEMQQKNKIARAAQRAANKVVAKYKSDRQELKSESQKSEANASSSSPASMWTPPKKHPTPNIQPLSNSVSRLPSSEKPENVMIRLQNGKICQALRFSDGRVAPIVRMDSNTKIGSSFDEIAYGGSKTKNTKVKPQFSHPHISLTGHRSSVASILKRPGTDKKSLIVAANSSTAQGFRATTSTNCQAALSGSITKTTSAVTSTSNYSTTNVNFQKPFPAVSTTPSQPVKMIHQLKSPVVKSVLPGGGVSQRLTLPSGQVINLVVATPTAAATSAASTKPSAPSLGKMFVDNIKTDTVSSSVASSTHSSTATLNQASVSLPLDQKRSGSLLKNNHANHQLLSTNSKSIAKPLGIVSPMQVRHTSIPSNADHIRPSAAKTLLSVNHGSAMHTTATTTQQQSHVLPNVVAPSSVARYVHPVLGSQEQASLQRVSSQPLQLGLQGVTLVTQPVYQQQAPQPVQLVQTLMPVQPVQFVQTVPIQVQQPVMFVSPNQEQLQFNNVDSSRYVLASSASSEAQSQSVTTQSPQQHIP